MPPEVLGARVARQLARRAPQVIDPTRAAAIKRNVHEVDVDVDAARFARALRDVLVDPRARFGLVRMARTAARVGRELVAGERFQGCFGLRDLAEQRGAPPWALRALDRADAAGLLAWIEERFASDHSELVRVELEPDADGVRRVAYRYLEGTPLAGESEYAIAPRGAGACRLEVAFMYQETTALAISLLHRFGLRAHDCAVLAQAEAAAARAGGRVVSTTIRA
jgi:hypothetical protein